MPHLARQRLVEVVNLLAPAANLCLRRKPQQQAARLGKPPALSGKLFGRRSAQPAAQEARLAGQLQPIGHGQRRGAGRSRRAQIGRKIGEGQIGFVADAAHNG